MNSKFEQQESEMVALPNAPQRMMWRPDCRFFTVDFSTGLKKKFVKKCFIVDEKGEPNIPLCPICHRVIHTPATSRLCGQEACDYCWAQVWKNASGNERWKNCLCMVCRAVLYIEDIAPFNEVDTATKLRMQQSLIMQCPNEGCEMTGNIFDIQVHRSFHCRNRLIICPNYYCGKRMPWNELAQHLKECTNWAEQSNCPNKCPSEYMAWKEPHTCDSFINERKDREEKEKIKFTFFGEGKRIILGPMEETNHQPLESIFTESRKLRKVTTPVIVQNGPISSFARFTSTGPISTQVTQKQHFRSMWNFNEIVRDPVCGQLAPMRDLGISSHLEMALGPPMTNNPSRASNTHY